MEAEGKGNAQAQASLNIVEEKRDPLDINMQTTDIFTIYLPLIMKDFPPTPPVFGLEINRRRVATTIDKATESNAWWVRYNGIVWHEVESIQGDRNWSALDEESNEIQTLSEAGLTPMVIIRGTPRWAQVVDGVYCGPIEQENLSDFASFVQEVVEKYSQPPYNVKYWELGNEPDAHTGVGPYSPYGCWAVGGDTTADYYQGGRDYAEMLSYVYPAIKEADPEAEVVLGGLLMWCDGDDPNPQAEVGSCPSSDFLDGILDWFKDNNEPFAFDVMAYHAYPFWYGGDDQDWDLTQPHWDHRNGTIMGKIDFIEERFDRYHINKPIVMNEGGLMCGFDPQTNPDQYDQCLQDDFFDYQANYVVRMYTRSWAEGLLGSTWYTLNGGGWREGGLLNDNQEPRPAYTTFKFMANLLADAEYVGKLYPDLYPAEDDDSKFLAGYAFRADTTGYDYRIYWSNDRAVTQSLSLPQGSKVYDKFGQDITPSNGEITIEFDPKFVEIP
jgi:hypothetical protein